MVLFAVELRLKMYMVMVMKKFAGKKKTVIDLLKEEITWNHVSLKAEREEKEKKKRQLVNATVKHGRY